MSKITQSALASAICAAKRASKALHREAEEFALCAHNVFIEKADNVPDDAANEAIDACMARMNEAAQASSALLELLEHLKLKETA